MNPCTPPSDPLYYRLLAVLLFCSAMTFLITFLLDAFRGRQRRQIQPFAWAMIGLAAALLIYATLPMVRQVFGYDYAGRDQIRSAASSMLSIAMLTISRVAHRNR